MPETFNIRNNSIIVMVRAQQHAQPAQSLADTQQHRCGVPYGGWLRLDSVYLVVI